MAQAMGISATRIQLRNKDPLSWAEAIAQLAEHSPLGSALTLRNYQALRPSLYDLEAELAAIDIPSLLIVGDEDVPCLEANLFLKRTMRTANLLMLPGTGHAVNLEEPAAFNDAVARFLASVERGSWRARDPRAAPGGPVLPIGRQD